MRFRWIAISALLLFSLCGFILRGGGSPATSSGSLPLVRTFNQPTGTTTPASAFWMIGQPSGVDQWPAGDIVTAKLGGNTVRVNSCNEDSGMLTHADGSIRWARLLVDYSGQTITPGSSANLVLTPTSGSWSTTTTRTNADWEALNDTVTIAPTSPATTIQYTGTTGVAGYDSPAGTWTATFDGGASNKIVTICTNPLGLYVKVYANFVNGATTHCQLRARMDYWVTETSGGALGPIESWGPFIDNTQMFVNSAPCTNGSGGYVGDITWLRNAVVQRSYGDVPITSMTIQNMERPNDAQGDWTASDPKVWVSQDYTLVRATKTIPPFMNGIVYATTGTFSCPLMVSISSVSSSVFTVPGIAGLLQMTGCGNSGFHSANLIEFTGSLGGLSGISLNTPYWACALSSTTFELFQTVTQANTGFTGTGTYACTSATGLITPTGTYSGGMSAQLLIGPSEAGLWSPEMGAPSTLPDISWPSEWGAAYMVANTQGKQTQARIQASIKSNIPIWVVDTDQCVVSIMDSVGTPTTGTNCMGGTGLGPARTTASWMDRQGFNIINVPSDSSYIWIIEGSHWPGAVEYMVWLLEGSEFLQDMVIQEGDRGAASRLPSFGRNAQINNTGPIYYGQSLTSFAPASARYGFWSFRDASNATYAAPEGSSEQQYFRNNLQSNVNAIIAYRAFKGANFSRWGVLLNDDDWGQCGSVGCFNGGPYVSQFMQWYGQIALGISAARDGEFITNLSSIYNPQLIVQENTTNCSFFSDAYTVDLTTSNMGDALPGVWISNIAELGYDNGGGLDYGFATTGNLITAPVTGWTTDVLGTLPWSTSDKYRPLNWDADATPTNTAPSPFVSGTDYFPTNISGANFNLAATNGGATITVGANQTGVGGYMLPTGQGCPASGMFRSNVTNPDSYAQEEIGALGIAAANGISGASTALSNMQNRMVTLPAICSTEAHECYGGTW